MNFHYKLFGSGAILKYPLKVAIFYLIFFCLDLKSATIHFAKYSRSANNFTRLGKNARMCRQIHPARSWSGDTVTRCVGQVLR